MDGQMLANPTPLGGQQQVFFDQPQTQTQPQFFYEPQMERQWNTAPTQNFEYTGYTDEMVGAPQQQQEMEMEDEMARHFKVSEGFPTSLIEF